MNGKKLIIVPHDVLHYLPFQVLYSTQGRYLVEDHSVTYLSSASLLQFVKTKRKAVGQKVLAFGNPSFDASKVNLPMAELETNEIRRLYPQAAIFTRSEANEATAKSLSPSYDLVHFATHAELNRDDPLSSAVLLAKVGQEDGRLEIREIFTMNLNASLVVLSGCETGVGHLSSGDELVGLTRAFIYAGTPSVVASLWKVDDASTVHLMSSFYRNLKTKSKVESLRQAQLDMIRGNVNSQLLAQRGVGGVGKLGQTPAARSSSQNSISTSHPYFWAPFILVGDGK
jgi:CHAT domain-containing protein